MKALFNLLLVFLSSLAIAQGIENNGAYIGTSNGVYLATSDLENDASGTIDLGSGEYVISAGLTNAGDLTLEGNLTVSGTLSNTGTFSIESGASLIDGGSTSGNFVVNKSILGNGPKYLSSPITTGVVGSFVGGFVYQYDEESSTWNALTSETASLSVMEGYSVEFLADKDITFTGSLNTSSVSKSLTNAGDGWNLVGNPYPSAMDWDNIPESSKINIGNAYYVWNATNGNYTTYLGSTSGLGVVVNPESGSDAGILPKMQAFFVKASGASPSLAVSNAARVHSSKEIIGNAARIVDGSDAYVKLRLTGSNERGDEIVVRIHDNASTIFDPYYDAFKLYSFDLEVPQLASVNARSEEMAIHSIPPESEQLVPLVLRANDFGQFKFEVVDLENERYDIYLIDHKEGISFDLRGGDYSFLYELNDTKRFELLFSSGIVTSVDELATTDLVVKNLYSGLSIVSSSSRTMNIELFDLSGKMILSEQLSLRAGQEELYTPSQASNIYVYRIYDDEKSIAGKLMVR